MNSSTRCLLLAVFLLGAATHAAGQDAVPTIKRAEALLRREKWSDAAEAFEKITAAEPGNGQAWFQLARARHQLEDWTGAADANGQAARFPNYRATALYNLSCAQSLGGELEQAKASLELAIAAGFLDFDLVAADADLQPLREQQALDLPPEQTYRELKAGGGILMRHAVIEPLDFDPERAYPALVAFAPGSGTRSADWMMQSLWEGVGRQEDWLVICLVAPEGRGWFTHPSHHALEDLLRSLKKEYEISGDRFHLLGYASSCRPALTYSGMSKKYFQSMTLVSSFAWGSYDDSDLKRWKKMPIHQIVGASSYTLESDREAHERLLEAGVHSTLTVVPDDGLLVETLRGADLLAAVAAAHLRE